MPAAGASVRVLARAGSLRIEGRPGTTDVVVRGTACASDAETLPDIRLVAERRGSVVHVEAVLPERMSWGFGRSYASLDLVIEVPATVSEVFGRSSEHTGETFTQQGDNILGQARVTERFEQGRPIFRLDGVSVSDRRFAVTTITSRNPGDRGWALTTWRSVENTAAPAA